MFALANMANVDATVAVWYAKNFYDFWRPFHAIRLADTDGNTFTEADPNWVSEHIVPPLQEYPSAHAIQCQAIARTLRSIFSTDCVSFATQSTTALPSNPVRAFNRLSAASRECRQSRIDEHFQRLSDAAPSLVDGATLGVAAAYTAHGGHPAARLVSLVSHAITLHGFFNHPFASHGSRSRSMRRSRPGPMSSPV